MWGQFTLIISSLSPKRDWGPEWVKVAFVQVDERSAQRTHGGLFSSLSAVHCVFGGAGWGIFHRTRLPSCPAPPSQVFAEVVALLVSYQALRTYTGTKFSYFSIIPGTCIGVQQQYVFVLHCFDNVYQVDCTRYQVTRSISYQQDVLLIVWTTVYSYIRKIVHLPAPLLLRSVNFCTYQV